MPRILFLIAIFFVSNTAKVLAQETVLKQLAEEVCSCMQGIKDETPRTFARKCLRSVAIANNKLLNRELSISPYDPDHINQLAEWLTDELASNCPIIETLKLPSKESSYRWSDGKLPPTTSTRLVFDKDPPADTTERIVTEAPRVWKASGVITRLEKQLLEVSSDVGEKVLVTIPGKLRRSIVLQVGEEATVHYRREWRLKEGRIVNVMVK